MIAIILDLIAEKNRVWKRILFHLSPIAMRLSRYAGATPGTGCCGDVPGRHLPDGLLPSIRVKLISLRMYLPRKEVIQPHLPVRLPCYDFTPVIGPAFGSSLLTVGSLTSGVTDSHGVTGGVYKARERIHRGMLIRDY